MKQEERKCPRCVQCGKEMPHGYGNEHFTAQFCEDPKCVVFGLLQTGVFPAEKLKVGKSVAPQKKGHV
jgi:hypothetical protein